MNIKVKRHKNDKWAWPVRITDKTHMTLKNGVVIPTASNMLRKAAKIK